MKSETHTPPKLAKQILLRFLRHDLAEEVSGDLEEKFYLELRRSSPLRAKSNYWYQVLKYFRPFAFRKSKSPALNQFAMLKNYFKIGVRNLFKNKGYSFINIGGLSIGMTVAILIGLWVYDELTFNRYHRNYDHIGQLMKGGIDHDGDIWTGQTSLAYPLIDELRNNYGINFKHIVEAVQPYEYILTAGETKISRLGQFIAPGAPEMLTLDMIYGNRNGLRDPHSIMLSETTAVVLFGETNPVGKMMRINTNMDVTVTGVYRDLPDNTKFHPMKFFAPWELNLIHAGWIKDQDWNNHFLHIYAQIAPGLSVEKVNRNIEQSEMKVIRNLESLEDLIAQKPRIALLPMKDWHLRSNFRGFKGGVADNSPMQFVWLVGTIGGFVLVLACINFMNLSTARSERRAREVGIRKSMGSFRPQLVGQFLSESYLVVLLAFALTLVLTFLALPSFNRLAAKDILVPWTNPWFWFSAFIFILITGLVAGSYPALYLSSFSPVKTLKGTFRMGRLASVPRKVLVVAQFTVSVTLIISTIIVYNRIIFAKNRPVGYTRAGLILVQKKSSDFYGKTDVLRDELKKTGVVEEISESAGKITSVWSNNSGFSWPGKDPAIEENFGTLGVSAEYGTTVRWEFIVGRDFSTDIVSDSDGVVINQSAAKYIGFNNPVGETIHWKNEWLKTDKDFRILGVVKDMVMDSPFEPTKPTVFFLRNWMGWINVKLSPDVSVAEALPKVESVFRKIIPTAPFDYEFADTAYAQKFAVEERIANLALVFAILAVFISCLGLFGLASFVAEQRTKEIGIRKVVGATVYNLWRMLSLDFVVLVIISCLLAIPIAWYALSGWLENYSYRVEISWWIFAATVAGAVVMTLATVSYQAVRAARMNPVESLKSE